MTWRNPLPYRLVATADPMSFLTMPPQTTGLPLPPHPGAFGVRRRFHRHEGIDLYAPQGMPVYAVEDGQVLEVRLFTGPSLGHDWWLPTYGVWVTGRSGTVLYGEVAPHVKAGQAVKAGEIIGVVTRVLKVDKGRPMSMLHLELRAPGNIADIEWLNPDIQPDGLLDPTPLLLSCCSAR